MFYLCYIIFQSGSIPTYADESAAFYVQTAAALSDGMIRVSVYLKDADNLAGIDAELFLIRQRFHLRAAVWEKLFLVHMLI